MIGGKACKEEIDRGLIPSEGQKLTRYEREFLWEIFVEIGKCWKTVEIDAINLKSSWLELIQAKTEYPPSYVGEYANAIEVVSELIDIYGKSRAYRLLFLKNGIPEAPPTTRLAHAKKYVLDEFIKMYVLAGGFRSFGGVNYKGYVGGSRFNRQARVRDYELGKEE